MPHRRRPGLPPASTPIHMPQVGFLKGHGPDPTHLTVAGPTCRSHHCALFRFARDRSGAYPTQPGGVGSSRDLHRRPGHPKRVDVALVANNYRACGFAVHLGLGPVRTRPEVRRLDAGAVSPQSLTMSGGEIAGWVDDSVAGHAIRRHGLVEPGERVAAVISAQRV